MNRFAGEQTNHGLPMIEEERRRPRLTMGVSTLALIVGAGAMLSVSPASAQYVIDNGDQEIVDGSDHDSPWTVPGNGHLTVGENAEGELIIQNGGQVNSTRTMIGTETGGWGRVTVTGTDPDDSLSLLLVEDVLTIGDGNATGTLVIHDGGEVQSGTGNIAGTISTSSSNRPTGHVTVGENATWRVTSGDLTVGYLGDGFLTIEDGGSVTVQDPRPGGTASVFIGRRSGAAGEVRVIGAGSSLFADFRVSVGAQGEGRLTIADEALVEAGSFRVGDERDSSGKITVTNGGVLRNSVDWSGITIGGRGYGELLIEHGGRVESGKNSGSTEIGSASGLEETDDSEAIPAGEGLVTVTGKDSTWTNGLLTVGSFGIGEMRILDGAAVESSLGGRIAMYYDSRGAVLVEGSGSRWRIDQHAYVGGVGSGTLTVAKGGEVSAGAGHPAGRFVLAQHLRGVINNPNPDNEPQKSFINIGAASGEEAVEPGILKAPGGLTFGPGDGTLVFNHASDHYLFDLDIRNDSSVGNDEHINLPSDYPSIASTIRHQHGTTTYTGDGSGFTGTTNITGGILNVTHSLGGRFYVMGGGILGGSGRVGDVNVANGGIIAPGMDGFGTLSMASLSMSGASHLHYHIGAPGTAGSPGTSDLIVIDGNLTLNGQLHLFDGGDAGIGHYRLMTYGGSLAGNGLGIATAGVTGTIQAGGGNVDLVISSGAPDPDPGPGPDPDPGPGPGPVTGDPNLQYWLNNSVPWTAEGEDWRNQGGDIDVVWAGNHGVFEGAGGTIAVEGSQSFKGLQFVSNGYELAGPGTLQTVPGGSELRVLAGETATIATIITGSGGINKTQGGTLVLTGANSYTGATQIAGGTLALQDAGSIVSSAALRFTGAGRFDVSGVTGPTARVNTLSGVAGSEIRLGATDLEIVQAAAGTYGGAITGAGEVALSGSGVLTLTGTASHTGLTSIANGSTLHVGDGGTSGLVEGDILNNGMLVFERSDDFTYDGILSGTGEFYLYGSGTATLTDDSHDYAGEVGIESDATLRLASDAVLGTSGLSIDPDATLAGSGRVIGNVTAYSGGIIAPGMDTLGTLTVDGNVLFHEDSILAVRIASNDDNDALAVNGEASLAGNVEVTAIDMAASYVDGQTYTILTATDPLDGAFVDAVMTNQSAFLTPTLMHNANDVELTIAVTADFTTVAETHGQLQVSSALNALEQSGDAQEVFNEIAMLNPDQARRAFDLTSGEIHASGQHVIDQTFGLFNRTLRQQAGAGTGGGNGGGQVFTAPLAYGPTMGVAGVAAIDDATTSAYADRRIAQAWLAPLGGRGTIDGDGNAATLDWWSAGLAGGYEGQIDLGTGNGFAGFGMGYIRSHGSVDARLSSFDADGFHIGAYGAWEGGPWQLAGSLAYAANRISTERNIVFGGLNRTAEADYWTHSLGFSGEAAYGMDMGGGTTFLPLFTLDAGWSGHGGFTETGAGALNLSAGSESWTRLDTGIGLGISHVAPTEAGRLVLEGRAVWEHAFADVVPSQSLSFAGSPVGFDVRGPAASRDRLRIGAGLAWDVAPDMTVRANYGGLFSSDQSSHSGSIGLNIKF